MIPRTPGHSLEVLFLADRTPPAIGGRESVLRELLRRQPPDRSCLIAPKIGGSGSFDRSAGIEVQRRPNWPFLGAAANRWLQHRHLQWVTRRRPPGMVVAFGLGQEAALAREGKRSNGVPFVLHLEAPELLVARGVLRGGGERGRAMQEILDECEAIVVAGRACRLEAYKAGVYPHRIEVIPPGVDLARFRPGPKPEALVRKLGTSRGPVLLTVAGRGPGKDPETLLRAVAALPGGRPAATLVVVGPVDASWRSLAESLRLGKTVRFIGTVPDAELPDWYRLADIFVHAHQENREAGIIPGVEVAFAEALASGLPIVATQVASTEASVDADRTGILVDPGAHARMAKAIAGLLESEESRSELATAARERAMAEHSAEVTAARFREFLEVVAFRRLGRGRLDRSGEAVPAERPAA